MFSEVINFIRLQYPKKDFIALHEPTFIGNEKKYVNECIDTTFVSSVGPFVDKFEQKVIEFTGAKSAVAVVNGTCALHVGLHLLGVKSGDEVVTQPLTFVATCNAIRMTGADPVFVDIERNSLGLDPVALLDFFNRKTEIKSGVRVNSRTGKRISAVIPMHSFGHPCRIDEIVAIAGEFGVPVLEDSAESLGSYYKGTHTGRFGKLGVLSFNGNKTITTGGGGMIITDDVELGRRAKHLTTTGKKPHAYEFFHDEVAFNYRLPNINAALGVAQLEQLQMFLSKKRNLANDYSQFFESRNIQFVKEPAETKSNYWLNSILLADRAARDSFLKESNESGVMTRPAWELMHRLPMYKNCQVVSAKNAEWVADRLVNIPSGVGGLKGE